jgi:hypothetical protein
MEEHAEKLVGAVPRDEDLRYAIETLEIEQARLIEAIRAMRAMAVSEDDYPGPRVKEQRDACHSVEQVVAFLRQGIGQHLRNFLLADGRRGSNWEDQSRPPTTSEGKEQP